MYIKVLDYGSGNKRFLYHSIILTCMPQTVRRGTLDELPVFDRFPSPDERHDHAPIFELAVITHKTTPQTNPPYKKVDHGGVIGRNPQGTVVYLASITMVMGGISHAYPEGIRNIFVDDIESYLTADDDPFRRI